jgi:uncharacterized pyridoxal phosphate-containing UPF0001 family protein
MAEELCASISPLPALRTRGLMTVGPWVDDLKAVTGSFRALKRVSEKISGMGLENVRMEHLSMGMSGDFEIAIAEGSTMVRLGRVIFGERRSR